MTEQRIFPLMVNGQFWKDVEVDEGRIRRGKVVIPVMSEITGYLTEIGWPDRMARAKQVVFRLVEVAEIKNNYAARWIQGFWAVDDDLYFKDGRLYLK